MISFFGFATVLIDRCYTIPVVLEQHCDLVKQVVMAKLEREELEEEVSLPHLITL